MTRRALITGITGQDGAYLAQQLLAKGYEVYGAHRRSASLNLWRLRELGITDEIHLVPFDLLEFSNVVRVLEQVHADEVYNLAAQSFVGLSFEQPIYTGEADALGVVRVLEAIRTVDSKMRFYQASTSEMFGNSAHWPQDEQTPFHPRSPYGAAKVYAHWMTVNYREAYGIHASSGILFNHESPLRGQEFVTRKITAGLAEIVHHSGAPIALGNLEAKRDWGFAGDYVDGMWRMLQQPTGGDFVLATGATHSVREFVEVAGRAAGMDIVWRTAADGAEEGIERQAGRIVVRVDASQFRPADVDLLVGRPQRAHAILGWTANTGFEQLVEQMVRADMDRTVAGKP